VWRAIISSSSVGTTKSATRLDGVADYGRGVSPKAIATALNRERAPGPRGGQWSASTIHGKPARGTGILNNELYIGRLVWNRLRYVKDPATGRRVSRLNPNAGRTDFLSP
jgi:hypothetical protein